ncbi:MAG TPA: ATP-binding protein [Paludibaculum sp.]
MLRSFRVQITAWYLALFALLFILFSVFLYATLDQALKNRLDEMLGAESRSAAALFLSEMQEMKGDAPAAAIESVAEMSVRGVVLAIFAGPRLLAANNSGPREILSDLVRSARATAPGTAFAVPRYSAEGGRAVIQQVEYEGNAYRVIALSSQESIAADLTLVRSLLYFGLPLLFLAAGLGGFWLATRSLRPLRLMGEQTRSITSQNLSRRLEIGPSSEELETLAQTFNELLARLDSSFETMHRLIADASHELRTPIAIIRGEADVALDRDRPPAEYRESLSTIHQESIRLSSLIDDLLNLARADAGYVVLRMGQLYCNDLLVECCRSVQGLAAAKAISVECLASADIEYRGDEALLRRMLLNLLDNAIRFTPHGGRIIASLSQSGDALAIGVSDSGAGVSAEAAPHVFDRFYCGDEARSREAGGFGLGLSIVKWIAEAHRGSVELTSTPGGGATFTVRLPF